MIFPIILCGGSGSRLWPYSRKSYPKQLLNLTGEMSMLQSTALRAAKISNERITLVCQHDYRFIVAEQLLSIGIKEANIILEPQGKNTAMAFAVAVQFLKMQKVDPNSSLVFMPADHHIGCDDVFLQTVNKAVSCIKNSDLVMLGVPPSSANENYGYIKLAKKRNNMEAFLVDGFIEKPKHDVASMLINQGNVLWNSGVYISSVEKITNLYFKHCQEIFQLAAASILDSICGDDFIRLKDESYDRVQPNSFDYAITENTDSLNVVTLKTEWSDLGSWEQLHELSKKDSGNNMLLGDVVIDNVKDSLIQAESRLVAAIDLENIVIVETNDAVLVADKCQSHKVKDIVSMLNREHRSETLFNSKIHTPWGYFETLDIAAGFKVKRIIVKREHRLSLQKHFHRSEHWVVVNGIAKVTCDDKSFILNKNQSTYIPKEKLHRLENIGDTELEVIEIQVGSYLGEDDIVRYQDNYDRKLTLHENTKCH